MRYQIEKVQKKSKNPQANRVSLHIMNDNNKNNHNNQ